MKEGRKEVSRDGHKEGWTDRREVGMDVLEIERDELDGLEERCSNRDPKHWSY